MFDDLKKYCFGCILPRCVLDLTTEVKDSTQQKIYNLHSRLLRRYYITTLPVKPPSSDRSSVQRTVYYFYTARLVVYTTGLGGPHWNDESRPFFYPGSQTDEEPTGW